MKSERRLGIMPAKRGASDKRKPNHPRSSDDSASQSSFPGGRSVDRRKFLRGVGTVIGGFALLGLPRSSSADQLCWYPYDASTGDYCDPTIGDYDICVYVPPEKGGPTDLGDECIAGETDECYTYKGESPQDVGDYCDVQHLAHSDLDECFSDGMNQFGDKCTSPAVLDPSEDDECTWTTIEVGDVCDTKITGPNPNFDRDECHNTLDLASGDVCKPTTDPAGKDSDECSTYTSKIIPETGDECDKVITPADSDVCASPFKPAADEGGDSCYGPPPEDICISPFDISKGGDECNKSFSDPDV